MALLDKFSAWIQSPEIRGLAQGMLQGSAPSMTEPRSFGGALGMGFAQMNRAGEEAEKRRLAEKYFGIAQGEFGLKKDEAARDRRLDDFVSQKIAEARGQGILNQDQTALSMIDQNPMQQLPGGDEITQRPAHMTYTVQEPGINGGKLTAIPAMDNGRQMSEQEAKQKYLSGKPNAQLLPPNALQGNTPGILNQPKPSGPSLDQLERAQYALWAKDRKGAVDALMGSEQNLTGLPQEYASYESLKKKLGADHPAVKDTKRALDARLKAQEQMTKNREKYLETADKRASSALTKKQLELQEVQSGYLPGSGGTIELTPEQQQALASQYELSIQNTISDSDSRKRALFASNIDKTIKQIDVPALVQYAGPMGAISKKIEQGKALVGKESDQYAKFVENLSAVETLAMQIRQFYGESITPATRKAIEDLVNPATWYNNPTLAKRQFQKITDILENETATFRGALTGTGEFKKQGENPGAKPASAYSDAELQAIINAGIQ